MGLRTTATAVALALAAVPPAIAQTGTELLEQGIGAYRDLELDQAAALIRRALDTRDSAAVPDTLRPQAYAYLGAVEHFRGRRQYAANAFRAALGADPRYRPDTLIFPPAVTAAFDEARRETSFVWVYAPADTSIPVGDGTYVVRLHASALHDLSVVLTDGAGGTIQSLYSGPIVDSLDVRWDGRAPDASPLTGALDLRVVSRSDRGGERVVRLPLVVRAAPHDTLPLPPPPDEAELRPEREAMRPAFTPLLAGVLTGIGAAVLPALVTDDGHGTSLRFAVGGALGVAGVVGFVRGSRGRTIPENVRANTLVRDAWRRELETVRSENIERRGQIRLRIIPGAQTVVEAGQ